MLYWFSKKLRIDFEQATTRTKKVLQENGFWILTEIDVQQKMKEKLAKDMQRYLILWACHPPSAYEAIQIEVEVGLLLPCNVIIYEKNDEVFVSAIKPTIAMSFVENPWLKNIAKLVEAKLEKVIQEI